MKKFSIILISIILFIGTMSVCAAQGFSSGDQDGDTNENPWSDLFTTVTTEITTTNQVNTTPEPSTEPVITTSEPTQSNTTTEPIATTSKITTGPVTTTENNITSDVTTNELNTTDKITEDNTTYGATTSELNTTTVNQNVTSSGTIVNITTTKPVLKAPIVGKTSIRYAKKELKSIKLKVKLKKVKGATKYQVKIAKKRISKKILLKKIVKNVKVTIKNKKLVNKKKLYISSRAIKIVNGTKYYGKWCKPKKIKIS